MAEHIVQCQLRKGSADMKIYEKPSIRELALNSEDIIMTSGDKFLSSGGEAALTGEIKVNSENHVGDYSYFTF